MEISTRIHEHCRNFVKNFNDKHPEITEAGITFDDENLTWSVKFTLTPSKLADTFLGDKLEEAFEPLINAIETLYSMNDLFNQLIQDAIIFFKK